MKATGIAAESAENRGQNDIRIGVPEIRWFEARELFPNTVVLVENLKSHIENRQLNVDDVAVIRPLRDGKEAMDELMKAHGKTFVYHTKHEQIAMPIRTNLLIPTAF